MTIQQNQNVPATRPVHPRGVLSPPAGHQPQGPGRLPYLVFLSFQTFPRSSVGVCRWENPAIGCFPQNWGLFTAEPLQKPREATDFPWIQTSLLFVRRTVFFLWFFIQTRNNEWGERNRALCLLYLSEGLRSSPPKGWNGNIHMAATFCLWRSFDFCERLLCPFLRLCITVNKHMYVQYNYGIVYITRYCFTSFSEGISRHVNLLTYLQCCPLRPYAWVGYTMDKCFIT